MTDKSGKSRIRRFARTDYRAMEAIKWLAAGLAGIPRKDITHLYVVMSRPVPGDPNRVIVGGAPCQHMTGIFQLAIENGEQTQEAKGVAPCDHKMN